MLTVGPRSTWAPFILVSSARACPTRLTRSVFQVEASEISAGKQVVFTPSVKLPAPRAPLGPSVIFKEGTPSRSTGTDRKSTRLNSSHTVISYAVFCLKKKKKTAFGHLMGSKT